MKQQSSKGQGEVEWSFIPNTDDLFPWLMEVKLVFWPKMKHISLQQNKSGFSFVWPEPNRLQRAGLGGGGVSAKGNKLHKLI